MANVDLTLSPWDRLIKLAPPGTNSADIQAAANRWALNADVYNAAADLWEDAATLIDLSPDNTSSTTPTPLDERTINKVAQDGITIEYASDGLIGNNQSTRSAQYAQMMSRVRSLRSRGKPTSPLVHDPCYNPWRGVGRLGDDPEIIIPVFP